MIEVKIIGETKVLDGHRLSSFETQKKLADFVELLIGKNPPESHRRVPNQGVIMDNFPPIGSTVSSFAPVALGPETPPLTCARQLILERVGEMVKHEEGTRKGEDIEALHDMRVWSRRLREALEIFAFCFPPKMFDKLYARVRRVTRTLGRARNADVAVEFFAKRLANARDVGERFALQDMLQGLTAEQSQERKKMIRKLDKKVQASALPQRLEAAFHQLAEHPPSRRKGPRTAVALARKLLADRLRTVFNIRRAITGEEDIEGLHNLRIAVKKLRYAIEVLDFAIGERASENLKFFKKLQTILGDLHDRDVFIQAVKARHEALQGKAFTSELLAGYEKIFQHLAQERHAFYDKYLKLFGRAKYTEWRKNVLPARPTTAPRTEVSPPNRTAADAANVDGRLRSGQKLGTRRTSTRQSTRTARKQPAASTRRRTTKKAAS